MGITQKYLPLSRTRLSRAARVSLFLPAGTHKDDATLRFGQGLSRWDLLQLCRSGRISWADMVLAPSVAGLFKWRQFEPEVILLAIGWYLRFSLS